MILLKHYRLSIRELKKLTSHDQSLMVRALVEKLSVGGQLHFATEEDYQKWRKEQGK